MKSSVTKTVGILTSGGDAPGLNAAIRGIARTAINEYGMKVIGIQNGYRGLIECEYQELKPFDVTGILTRGGTILGTSREKPFKNPEKDPETGRTPVESIKHTYKKLGLDALVVLGGNGTNTTGYLLSQEGLNIILKQANRGIRKDKFSSLEYALYYIRVEEENKKRKKKKFVASDWCFMN